MVAVSAAASPPGAGPAVAVVTGATPAAARAPATASRRMRAWGAKAPW